MSVVPWQNWHGFLPEPRQAVHGTSLPRAALAGRRGVESPPPKPFARCSVAPRRKGSGSGSGSGSAGSGNGIVGVGRGGGKGGGRRAQIVEGDGVDQVSRRGDTWTPMRAVSLIGTVQRINKNQHVLRCRIYVRCSTFSPHFLAAQARCCLAACMSPGTYGLRLPPQNRHQC